MISKKDLKKLSPFNAQSKAHASACPASAGPESANPAKLSELAETERSRAKIQFAPLATFAGGIIFTLLQKRIVTVPMIDMDGTDCPAIEFKYLNWTSTMRSGSPGLI